MILGTPGAISNFALLWGVGGLLQLMIDMLPDNTSFHSLKF